jgi:hypothetical protein
MSLPLLAPAQAQKHVTVNEALSRLDALGHLTIASASLTTPPTAAPAGDVYAVPTGAVNAWSGRDGMLALSINGGWVFVQPRRGWRALVLDSGAQAIWDGSDWRMGAVTLSPSNSVMALKSTEFEVLLGAGDSVSTPIVIPARSLVFGVTGRVTATITGTATSWDLGVESDNERFGVGLGLDVNSWVNGPAAPMVYWEPAALKISAQGGDFSGGAIRLIVHYAEIGLPAPV